MTFNTKINRVFNIVVLSLFDFFLFHARVVGTVRQEHPPLKLFADFHRKLLSAMRTCLRPTSLWCSTVHVMTHARLRAADLTPCCFALRWSNQYNPSNLSRRIVVLYQQPSVIRHCCVLSLFLSRSVCVYLFHSALQVVVGIALDEPRCAFVVSEIQSLMLQF